MADKEVVAIVSDACFKDLPRIIGDSFRTGGRPPTETKAAIIVADDHFNLQAGNRQAAVVILVTGLTSLPGSASASKSESIAIILGLQICRWLSSSPSLYTDCRALVTGTRPMDPLLRSSAQLGDVGGLLHCIRRYREDAMRKHGEGVDNYHWCRGHPERRTPNEQWDTGQWLIWIADHYADLNLAATTELQEAGAVIPEHGRFEVYAADVLGSAWNPGDVTYRMYGLPMAEELLSVILKRRAQLYLETRERTTTNAFPWASSQIALIPGMLKQTMAFKVVENRGRSSKFLWDHIGHGRNQRKWSATESPADPCPLCGNATDDMQHIAVECSNAAMMEKRSQCWLDCRKVLDHALAQGIAGRYALAMIETMEAGRTRDTHAIMLGRPLDYQVRRWDNRFGPQAATMGDTFRKLACRILAITMTAVIALWKCRGLERQCNRMAGESLQQILFEDGCSQESVTQDDYRDHVTGVNDPGLRNRPVAAGGLGAAISRMVVGIEYAPDPPI